jgi:hypothetical protein
MIEILAAVLLAAAAIWLVLGPLMWPERERARAWEPPDPEETARGVALSALREIEFDRETGKLSDADYAELKSEYTVQAVAALRQEERTSHPVPASDRPTVRPSDSDLEAMISARARALAGGTAPACRTCGPRPESDAVFCSSCGRRLDAAAHCARCSAPLAPGSNFCESCGTRVAA